LEPNVSIVLVGSKVDVEQREVDQAMAQKYASDRGMSYIECSAKTGHNVFQVFDILVQQSLSKLVKNEPERGKE
jgi:GTPase SAR1 family protein